MSEIEIVFSETNESESNESDNNQQENSDFVDWINNLTFQENFNLNYPFDKRQTICTLFWILIFIIFAIILILLSRK